MSTAELATSYAALILADDDVDVTVSDFFEPWVDGLLTSVKPDKLLNLIKAANVEDVEPIWTTLYAKVCRNR